MIDGGNLRAPSGAKERVGTLAIVIWIHETFKEHWGFQWQEGYGAFSIGVSGVASTTKYIQRQAEHHRKMTFREEIEMFLKKHGMEYVERDLE